MQRNTTSSAQLVFGLTLKFRSFLWRRLSAEKLSNFSIRPKFVLAEVVGGFPGKMLQKVARTKKGWKHGEKEMFKRNIQKHILQYHYSTYG